MIFVLCTTDPQKILETILSRCQRFDFHRIGNEDIEHRLSYVCEQEGFDYDDEALAMWRAMPRAVCATRFPRWSS